MGRALPGKTGGEYSKKKEKQQSWKYKPHWLEGKVWQVEDGGTDSQISQIVKCLLEDFGLHFLDSGMTWKIFKQGSDMTVSVFSIDN